MNVIIKLPGHSRYDDDELFLMFKMICDNIDTNGIECSYDCSMDKKLNNDVITMIDLKEELKKQNFNFNWDSIKGE